MAVVTELKRGKGTTCSLSCAAKLQSPKNQFGPLNPNWRGGSEPYRDAKRRYRERHREKAKAHILVRDAILAGRLLRLPCDVCNSIKTQAHHDDYTKPLKVRWLCKTHHEMHHVSMRAAGLEKYHARHKPE